MKSLGLTVLALLLCATMSFAQSNRSKTNKEPFATSIEKLSRYLDLKSAQIREVASINEYFIEMQRESLRAGRNQEKKMQHAVYGNLKLMKQVLTPEQYRKYVVLLNVTNNNNRIIGIKATSNVYLAAKQ